MDGDDAALAGVGDGVLRHPYKVGDEDECPTCRDLMVWRADLAYDYEVDGEIVCLRELDGFRCISCGETHWSGATYDKVRQVREVMGGRLVRRWP